MKQSKECSNSVKIRDLVTGEILWGRISFLGQLGWERSYSVKLDVGGVIRITHGTLLPGFRFIWTPKLVAQFKLHTYQELVTNGKPTPRPKAQSVSTPATCKFRGSGYCECGQC